MEPPEPGSLLALALVLVAVNAFFVAAEYSLIAFRRPRVEPSRPGGDRKLPVPSARIGTLALAAQVGRSAASLSLGYVAVRAGDPLFAAALDGTGLFGRVAAAYAAATLTILLIVVLHVVLGEQVPKLIAISGSQGFVSRVTLPPLRAFALVLTPLLWLLDRLVGAVVGVFGVRTTGFHPLVHTAEEIRLLIARSSEQGAVEEDEREMLHGVFEFSDTVAREVMTPRTDIVAVPVDIGLPELVDTITREGHSRLPVYDGSIDTVVGVVLAKDLLPVLPKPPAHFSIATIMRDPYFVPDTKPVDDLLAEFRTQSVHLAIVLDEFGGTYGLVTMEDLLEEIVGEIHDEYDVAAPDFAATPEGDVLIDGGAAISEVNERFATALPEEDFDTVGGYIFGALGRVPEAGDAVSIPGVDGEMELSVEEMEERRVLSVRLSAVRVAPKP